MSWKKITILIIFVGILFRLFKEYQNIEIDFIKEIIKNISSETRIVLIVISVLILIFSIIITLGEKDLKKQMKEKQEIELQELYLKLNIK